MRDAIKKKKCIETKSSAVDLVTESDKAVEKHLISGLSSAFPDHKLVFLYLLLLFLVFIAVFFVLSSL